MGRLKKTLTAQFVKTINDPGRHADGGGLYLEVKPSGSRSWIFVSRRNKKWREWGLGAFPIVTLAEAREQAIECRRLLSAGRDPAELRAPAEIKRTFGESADEYIEAHRKSWRNAKHVAQWEMTLKVYAEPLRGVAVDKVSTELVLDVLRPIWQTKPETASRLRGRIEAVLNAAKARGLRSGENPAQWRGHLDTLLPKRSKLSRGHHAAMKIDELPTFIGRLGSLSGLAARALEFTILTAARSGEVLGARWDEIDFDERVWTTPAARMKGGREHIVPLSMRALNILKQLKETRQNEFVFPGQKPDRPLSSMAMEMVLRRLEVDVTVHGFRSTFSDWCSERTQFSSEVREMALAHTIANKAEAAYRRGPLLEKRRKLMDVWANFCSPKTGGNIVKMTRPS